VQVDQNPIAVEILNRGLIRSLEFQANYDVERIYQSALLQGGVGFRGSLSLNQVVVSLRVALMCFVCCM
jgi:hypothetical protein